MTETYSAETVRLSILKGILASARAEPVTLGVDGMDDAAVVNCPGGGQLVIASDFVRGSEFYLFQLGYLDYFDVGYYLIAANISDMAAMGVKPAGLLTVIRYTKKMSDADFASVFSGMSAAADRHGAPIIGGDTGGYIADVFSATAFGFADEGRFLTRRGAAEGDILCVTGCVGGAIAALTYFKELRPAGAVLPQDVEDRLLARWKRPDPKVAIGWELAFRGLASACMDVSDGLKASVGQLASGSGIGFRLYEDRIPIDSAAAAVAEVGDLDLLTLATSASVDFELLFTAPADKVEEVRTLFAERSWALSEIGVAGEAFANDLVGMDGTVRPLPGTPWDHQQGDHVKTLVEDATKRGRR